MTKNQIKEAISVKFIELIVNHQGHKVVPIPQDHGVDFSIREVVAVDRVNGRRYVDSGKGFDVQIKSTTEDKISISQNYIIYKCEAKTYNDLIQRRKESINPLVLIVFILPTDEDEWIMQQIDSLTIKKLAYYYIPSSEEEATTNVSSVNIKIPAANLFNKGNLIKLFEEMFY